MRSSVEPRTGSNGAQERSRPLASDRHGGDPAPRDSSVSSVGAEPAPVGWVRLAEQAQGRAWAEELLLGSLCSATALGLAVLGLARPRARRALAGFDGTYQLCTDRTAWRLCFRKGLPFSRRGRGYADFEIHLLDLAGALAHLQAHPKDLLSLTITGKIRQRGNLYYLFKLGYLLTLLQQAAGKRAP